MIPQIVFHYQLSQSAFKGMIENAESSIERHQQIVITRADTPNLWPTLVQRLTFADNAEAIIAAGTSDSREGLTATLVDFPEAERIWTPADAAQHIVDYFAPLVALEDEIERVRAGDVPWWLPESGIDAKAWTGRAQMAATVAYEFFARRCALDMTNVKRILDAVSIRFSPPANLEGRSKENPWGGFRRCVATATGVWYSDDATEFAREEFAPLHLALGPVIFVRPVFRNSDPTFLLRVGVSDEIKEKMLQEDKAREAERDTWIRRYGSQRLRRIVAAGLVTASRNVYADERLAKERPGWFWTNAMVRGQTYDLAEMSREPFDVPVEALDLLDMARRIDPDAVLRIIFFDESLDYYVGYGVFGRFLGLGVLLPDGNLAAMIDS